MTDNNITVVGNLTRDPELRFTQGGRAVCTLGLAVNRRYQVNNEWQEETSFLNCVLWGQLGENVSASCQKGARVFVTGRLQQRSYQTEADEKRSVVEIIADDCGPSLKWATAVVERTQRTTEGAADKPSGQPQQQRQDRAPDPVYGSEEPF